MACVIMDFIFNFSSVFCKVIFRCFGRSLLIMNKPALDHIFRNHDKTSINPRLMSIIRP